MNSDISSILKRLHLKSTGRFDNHFYVIQIDNSDEYAKVYSLLDEFAINTEYPNFIKNSNNQTQKIINYFEIEENSSEFLIFLIADFKNDSYYLKIGEK